VASVDSVRSNRVPPAQPQPAELAAHAGGTAPHSAAPGHGAQHLRQLAQQIEQLAQQCLAGAQGAAGGPAHHTEVGAGRGRTPDPASAGTLGQIGKEASAPNPVPAGGADTQKSPTSTRAGAPPSPSSAQPPASPGSLYQGGTPGAKDAWGDSHNVNKPAVFQQVYGAVQKNWDNGNIPQNVKDLFSSDKTDPYFKGLNLSSDATTKAQQKAAIWQLATASHETGGQYDPSKLPSYYEAGGSGTGAGQTQFPGMAPDPKGMTYGMFSTQSDHPIDLSDPGRAVVADLQKFGFNYANNGGDMGKTLQLIGQTDSTSVIPSIQAHGAEYLDAFKSDGSS
jgi:hypothetical protein